MKSPDAVVHDLLPLLRRFCAGPGGIALGGSCAKGCSDELSDVDVYLFADHVLPGAERSALVTRELGAAAAAVSWGRDEPFAQGGTDFWHDGQRVECWLRSTRGVEATLAECARGHIRREPVVWAVMGFFSYGALADVRSMRIVEDPHGTLARWKAAVAEYPEALRREILGRFMPEAAFWPENPHYLSAVERADLIYTSAIVQQVLQALIQVVFALNRAYFPGEKKLAQAMETLPVQPDGFARRLRALLSPGGGGGVEGLRAQQRELAALVAEMQRLVSADEEAAGTAR